MRPKGYCQLAIVFGAAPRVRAVVRLWHVTTKAPRKRVQDCAPARLGSHCLRPAGHACSNSDDQVITDQENPAERAVYVSKFVRARCSDSRLLGSVSCFGLYTYTSESLSNSHT